jgi:hypothetical protein
MASFPTSKVHRVSRRKLGRGQSVPVMPVVATITAVGSVAHVAFSSPVVVNGPLPLAVAGGPTYESQVLSTPSLLLVTFSAALAAKTWVLTGGGDVVLSMQGGVLAPASGTF